MKRNALTVQFVKSVKAPGRYHDGGGLMLVVRAAGYKGWIQRLVVRGRRRDIGVGPLDRVALAQARRRAFENRCTARDGGDPTVREEVRAIPTFGEALEAVLDIQRAGWRDGSKNEGQWRSSLRDYAMPKLGDKPVNEITAGDILEVVSPIWHTKAETARRTKQRISAICRWAVAQGYRVDDPTPAVTAALSKSKADREHQRALPYEAVSGALAVVRATRAWIGTRLAFEFLVLTAARSGEVRGAKWSEVDLDAKVWTIPGARTKTGRPHRIPLSPRAIEVLNEAAELRDGSGLVFPSVTGCELSDSTISKLVRENGIEAVPHGFRSSFRQWAAERTSTPREVCEFALGHVVGDEAERAYQRSDLFDKRRELMIGWSRYLDSDHAAKVVPLRA